MSSNRLVLTALRGTTRAPRTGGVAGGIRLVAHFVGIAIFAVLVAVIVTRMLVVSTVQGVLDVGLRNRPSRQGATARARWRWAALSPTLIATLIVLCTLALWCVSMRWVDVRAMNDLGLVSVLSPSSIIALVGLTLGFCLVLSTIEGTPSFVLLFYLFALIFMLYATPALVEQAPRFDVTYWLAGHTEYVLRNGSVAPYLDAYFNWPGFFVLTGLLTKITGVSSVLAFAPWASFAYNLLYLAPMYLIFTTATEDRRTVWLGLWFFYITDWVWQDYFDPQGLNFFFYLVIIAILLKGFKTARAMPGTSEGPIGTWWRFCLSAWARVRAARPARIWANMHGFSGYVRWLRRWVALSDGTATPEQRRRRIALLCILIAVFAFSVGSHPITPFFVLLSVTALTLFGRITPRWLPLLLAAMILGWDFTAAMPYLAGHLGADLASFGNFQVVASTNVTNRLAAGSSAHQFVSHVRILATASIWGLAMLGALLRWRGNSMWAAGNGAWGKGSLFSHDVTFLLLVIAPGFLVIAQPYGGEMAMRYYLFTLPIVSFFAAAAFRTRVTFDRGVVGRLSRRVASKPVPVAAPAIAAACLLLLGAFLFARYGNERADYFTYDEANAVAYLYEVAPPHSLLLQGWTGTPWRYEDLELYNYSQLYTGHGQAAAFEAHDIGGILDMASNAKYPSAYVIFSRSQKAQAQMFAGVPPSAFTAVEGALLASGKFTLIYSNPDAEILAYVHPVVHPSVHPPSTRASHGHPPRTSHLERG